MSVTRLELSDGASHKFWEVSRQGATLRTRWGRIGTDGQTQDKAYASPAAAQQELDKLVASKRKKGYGDAKGAKGAKGAKVAASARTRSPAATPPAGPPAPAPGTVVPVTRVPRTAGLMELSGLGQIGPDFDEALKYSDRTRFVQYADATKKLLKIPRIRKLELSEDIPPWIGQLTSLRTLIATTDKLPASLFTLPHLRFLHLDGSSKLTSLRGVDQLRALETLTCGNCAIADDELAAVAKQLGGTPSDFMPGIDVQRTAPKPPRDRKAIVAAMNADTLPDGTDLRKIDLSGATFEHVLVSHDLRGAKLAKTVWRSCDFEWAQAAGAELTGASFYDCYFSNYGQEGLFAGVKAVGVTFVGCGGDLSLPRADVRGAQLLDLESDVRLDLTKANAQGLKASVAFASEKEHAFETKGADLRGAHIFLDVGPGRRAELKKKKGARLAWKTDHFKGAKTDKTTRIEYATLDAVASAPSTRPAEQTISADGPAAKILAPIYAPNAGLWLIVADAEVAAGWRGSVDEKDPRDDFQRALAKSDGEIAIGTHHGVCVNVGHRSGWSHIFRLSDEPGIRLIDASLQEDDRAVRDLAIARRVAQWPLTSKPRVVGSFACTSGVVAMLLPFCDGAFSAALRKKARPGTAVVEAPDYNRALVAMSAGPGLYEVAQAPFRPEKGKGDYEDELGDYGEVTLIRRVGKLPS